MACCCSLTGKKGGRNPPRLAIASEGVGYHCCCGCRWRQKTTTSLHGSSSFFDLKKRRKKPTPSRNCKRGGGLSLLLWCRRRQMTTTSLHGSLLLLLAFVDLEK